MAGGVLFSPENRKKATHYYLLRPFAGFLFLRQSNKPTHIKLLHPVATTRSAACKRVGAEGGGGGGGRCAPLRPPAVTSALRRLPPPKAPPLRSHLGVGLRQLSLHLLKLLRCGPVLPSRIILRGLNHHELHLYVGQRIPVLVMLLQQI